MTSSAGLDLLTMPSPRSKSGIMTIEHSNNAASIEGSFDLQHLEAQHLLTLRLKPQHGPRLKFAHASDTALPAAVRKPVLPHLHFWGTLPLLQLPLSGLAVAWLFTEVSACSMMAANTLRLAVT